MRGFLMILFTVMMLALLAPMTAMACMTCDSAPVLDITMEKWLDVVTAKARVGPGDQPNAHEGTFNSIGTTLLDDGMCSIIEGTGHKSTVSDYIGLARATGDKAGGAAILASGEPMATFVKPVVI